MVCIQTAVTLHTEATAFPRRPWHVSVLCSRHCLVSAPRASCGVDPQREGGRERVSDRKRGFCSRGGGGAKTRDEGAGAGAGAVKHTRNLPWSVAKPAKPAKPSLPAKQATRPASTHGTHRRDGAECATT